MAQTSDKDITYEDIMRKKNFLEELIQKEKYKNFQIYGYYSEKKVK